MPRYVTPVDLAQYMGVTWRTVRRWILDGVLRATHFQARHYTDDRPRKSNRGRWRIHEEDLQQFLLRHRARPYQGRWRRG